MSINPLAGTGGASRLSDIASSFAADLARRMGKGAATDPAGAAPAEDPALAEELAAKTEALNRLENALGGTVSHMAEKLGDTAASAMIGIIPKSIGNGEITEESLGNAFLDVIRFVDKNFGINEGDALMEHLNGSLNQSMNDFFDNGLSEMFMAVPAGAAQAGAQPSLEAANGGASAVAGQFTNAIKAMLEEFVRAEQEKSGALSPYTQAGQNQNLVGVLADVSA